MNANQARAIQKKAIEAMTFDAYEHIKRMAEKGRDSVSIQSPSSEVEVAELIRRLKADGYTVKRDQYSDCRESWDTLEVSWKGGSAEDYYSK